MLGGALFTVYTRCDIAELSIIAVKQECQGFGLGTYLVAELL